MTDIYLGRRVLVALHLAECLMSGIEDELRRVVTEETLAHVHDGLNRRCLSSFIDDRPNTLLAL